MNLVDLNKPAQTLTQSAEKIAAGAEVSLKDALETAEVALADTLTVAGGEVDRLTKMIDQRVGDLIEESAAWRKLFADISDRIQVLPRILTPATEREPKIK